MSRFLRGFDQDLYLLARWIVPAVCTLCAVMVLLSLAHDYRRVWRAEEVAAKLRANPPQDLQELRALFGNLPVLIRSTRDPEVTHTLLGLACGMNLQLQVQFEPETERLLDVGLVYGWSDTIPLDNPRSGLRRPVPWSWSWAAPVLAMLAVLFSRYQARRFPLSSHRSRAFALLAVIPALVILPFAAIHALLLFGHYLH